MKAIKKMGLFENDFRMENSEICVLDKHKLYFKVSSELSRLGQFSFSKIYSCSGIIRGLLP